MTSLVKTLSLLTPYDIDLPKHRIGPNTDGGYVFAGDLKPNQTVLSYGISTEFRFDEDMARRGHQVHMFDHTIAPLSPSHVNMIFHGEGVAGVSSPSRHLFSIADHLEKYGIAGDNLILKIDVEGAEYETFAAMDMATLRRFDQIVMEVHNIARIADAGFRALFDSVFRKINEHFTLFHVHANNSDGDALQVVEGAPIAGLLELSYIKSSLVQRKLNMTVYPTDLDYPCVNKRDKMLWFYPFLPTSISVVEIERAKNRADLLSSRIEKLSAKPDRNFDQVWYRSHYGDLAALSDDSLRDHFHRHGIREGRFGSAAEKELFELAVTDS